MQRLCSLKFNDHITYSFVILFNLTVTVIGIAVLIGAVMLLKQLSCINVNPCTS